MLRLLTVVCWLGVREAIGLAAAVAIPYLALNAFVLMWGLGLIVKHPGLLSQWHGNLHSFGDWTAIFVASAIVFPKLALGLSGFETGVSVIPLVSGDSDGETKGRPEGRIRATRKLLVAAALIMSVMLLTSSLVATLLIPESAYRAGGVADGRALAYLAHEMLGNVFGTIYDLSTILVLWFAGAASMTGLLALFPRYLPRFGMAPRSLAHLRHPFLFLLPRDIVHTMMFRSTLVPH